MGVHPVIMRELRAEARNPVNYWMRLGAALAAVVTFGWCMLTASRYYRMTQWGGGGGDLSAVLGSRLAGELNLLIVVIVGALAPILTADCLSREKREGTLGLLFLTPLRAGEIVAAKSVIHGLRFLTLMLAVMPVGAVTMLLGGVSWQAACLMGLNDLSVLVLGLSSGIVASAICRNWNRAVLLALTLATPAYFLFLLRNRFFALLFWSGNSTWSFDDLGELIQEVVSPMALGATGPEPLQIAAATLGVVGLLGWLALRGAARWVEAAWQDQPPTVRQLERQRVFFAPRFWRDRLRRKLQQSLDGNPIGWLQQYSWGGRMTKWGWCLFMVVMETFFISTDVMGFMDDQYFLAQLLLLGMSYSAADSFIRERRSGAMELILVTPLSVRQIVVGRLKGVWGQFLPALAVMLVSVSYGLTLSGYHRIHFSATFLMASLVVIPVIGVYFSLRRRSFIAAWVLTGLTGYVLPSAVGTLASVFWPWDWSSLAEWLVVLFQIWLGRWAWVRLHKNLATRNFEVNLV
jgi:ABC-type transport system involved in multi-copper enzyme maturation permease subunit